MALCRIWTYLYICQVPELKTEPTLGSPPPRTFIHTLFFAGSEAPSRTLREQTELKDFRPYYPFSRYKSNGILTTFCRLCHSFSFIASQCLLQLPIQLTSLVYGASWPPVRQLLKSFHQRSASGGDAPICTSCSCCHKLNLCSNDNNIGCGLARLISTFDTIQMLVDEADRRLTSEHDELDGIYSEEVVSEEIVCEYVVKPSSSHCLLTVFLDVDASLLATLSCSILFPRSESCLRIRITRKIWRTL